MYSTLIAIRSPKERYKSEFERLMTARLVVLQVHADAQEVLPKALGFRADSSDCVLSIWSYGDEDSPTWQSKRRWIGSLGLFCFGFGCLR